MTNIINYLCCVLYYNVSKMGGFQKEYYDKVLENCYY